MSTFEELDHLGSQELHDRAFQHAKRHLNAKFFWRLLESIPAAEASQGDISDADGELSHPSLQVASAVREDPKLADALRPMYIEYLLNHPDA